MYGEGTIVSKKIVVKLGGIVENRVEEIFE